MTDREKTIDRIQKLLALATSPYDGEAQSAMEKAGQLLVRAGLTMEEVQAQKTEDSRIEVVRVTERADRKGWLESLAVHVAKTFDCEVLKAHRTYSDESLRRHVMIFIGLKRDVEIAASIFTYLTRQVNDLADGFRFSLGRSARGNGHALEVDAYRIGVVKTVGRRLREVFAAKTATIGSTELVLVKSQLVTAACKRFFPNVNTSRQTKKTGSYEAYQKGLTDGARVAINRMVDGRGQARLG